MRFRRAWWVQPGRIGTCRLAMGALALGLPLLAPSLKGAQLQVLEPSGEAQGEVDPGDDNSPYLGLVADDRQESGQGIRVIEVVADGPADAAGLMAGDLIVGLGGQPVTKMAELAQVILQAEIGDTLELEVVRDGQSSRRKLILAARPASSARAFPNFGPIGDEPLPLDAPDTGGAPRRRLLGLRAAPLSDEIRRYLRVPGEAGVVVTEVEPDSPAFAAGMTRDMVIVAIDGQPVQTPADLADAVTKAGPGREIELSYYVNGQLQKRRLVLREVAEAVPGLPSPPRGGPSLIGDAPAPASGPNDIEGRLRWLEQRLQAIEARLDQLLRSMPEQP